MLKFMDDISAQPGEFTDVMKWTDYENFVHEANNEALDESTTNYECLCDFGSLYQGHTCRFRTKVYGETILMRNEN